MIMQLFGIKWLPALADVRSRTVTKNWKYGGGEAFRAVGVGV
jgi:hypothetical protein